ncbi:unnamed protein product [Blepharisma stoltei]|uniref:Uncharacterized protein n=1 Tax=Blepharisma stoltei TaxID=1481888 RepID=A0AAU9JZ35_9CILI|nr:unnamed protein product [Blepharisma stoltei]
MLNLSIGLIPWIFSALSYFRILLIFGDFVWIIWGVSLSETLGSSLISAGSALSGMSSNKSLWDLIEGNFMVEFCLFVAIECELSDLATCKSLELAVSFALAVTPKYSFLLIVFNFAFELEIPCLLRSPSKIVTPMLKLIASKIGEEIDATFLTHSCSFLGVVFNGFKVPKSSRVLFFFFSTLIGSSIIGSGTEYLKTEVLYELTFLNFRGLTTIIFPEKLYVNNLLFSPSASRWYSLSFAFSSSFRFFCLSFSSFFLLICLALISLIWFSASSSGVSK